MNAFLSLREMSAHLPSCGDSVHSPSARVRRVLVLDDDTTTRRLTTLFLEHAGFSVDVAEDGELGWDALCSAHYDLLVTDNDMPHLTGMKLVERLRLAGQPIPVIIASGSLELREAQDYPQLGLAAVLHKPFSFFHLISVALRAAPIAPGTGEGAAHCLEPRQDHSIHFPSPTHTNARPGTFAQTA